ncbi:MAG: protein kinase [Fibrobacterota bacterium]
MSTKNEPQYINLAAFQKHFPQLTALDFISAGGYKLVYKALIAGNVEALKAIKLPPQVDDEVGRAFRQENIRRVNREIEALAKCDSPCLVKLGSIEKTEMTMEGHDWIIYSEEFLDGPDLWKLIRTSDKPSATEIKTLCVSLLLAIKEVWRNNYIHRDIKPCNVIKTNIPERPFVLLDLGIAFAVNDTAVTANPMDIPATRRYIAPEMLVPGFRTSIDYRADLYTTALTIFEYAAKQHPLAENDDDPLLTLSRALHQPPKLLKPLRPDLSPDFCQLIDQLLKKKPALRPSNIDSLIRRIQEGA